MRHPLGYNVVAEAPYPVVHTGGGYYPHLASTFPAPRLRPSRVYCLLLRNKALNIIKFLAIPLLVCRVNLMQFFYLCVPQFSGS